MHHCLWCLLLGAQKIVPFKAVGQRHVSGPLSFRRMRECSHRGEIWWEEMQPAYRTTLAFHLISYWISWGLKKYLNALQRKKASNCRNSLSLATTISKGNPGTASLWRRTLEIFSEPRSNKEQKWVFVMSMPVCCFLPCIWVGIPTLVNLLFSWVVFKDSPNTLHVQERFLQEPLELCQQCRWSTTNSYPMSWRTKVWKETNYNMQQCEHILVGFFFLVI